MIARRWKALTVATVALAATAGVATWITINHSTGDISDRPAPVSIPNTRLTLVPPAEGQPIVLIVDTSEKPDQALSDTGYLATSFRTAGMGTIRIESNGDQLETTVRRAIIGVGKLPQFRGTRVGLIVAGHEAGTAWTLLADPPPSLRTAVLMNVPGEQGLDFRYGRTVAVLSLNIKADTLATNSHHNVHMAMAQSTMTHQVITYGHVGASAFSPASPDFDKATADDAKSRATEWLKTRDGVMNQSPSTGD